MTDVAQQTSGSNDASHLSDPYDEAVGHVLAEEQGSLRLPLEPISPSSSATPDAVSPSLALPFFAPEAEGQATAPYIAAARDVLDEDDFQRRVTIYQALEVTPGRSAGAARIGQMFGGIPAPIVEENLDEYRRAADYYDVLDKVRMSPALSELGQDPDYLYRVAGDITTFSDFDASFGQAAIQQGLQPKQSVGAKILDGVTRFADGSIGSIRALAAAPFSGSAALWNLMRSPADLVGANGLSDFFKHETEVSAQTAADVRGDQSHATPLQRTIYQALEGAGVAILTLPASAITGNPAPTLAVMSAMTAGQSYDEAIAQGLSPLEATLYAGGQAMTDYIAGRIPLAKLVRSVKVSSPFFKTVAGQFVLQSGNDQIARHWQDFNSWMALHPEKTFDDYLKERPNAAFEAFIAGATASFMQTTGAYAIDGGIAKAKAGAASIREWLDVARKAKGQNSDPAQLAADLQRLAEAHNIGEVHIAAPELMQTLQQAGDHGQAVLSQLPSLAGQLPEALATGGDVQIPTGELLTAVSGSHAEEALVQHLHLDPEAPSLAQAEQSAGETTALSQPAGQDGTISEALPGDNSHGKQPQASRAGFDEVGDPLTSQIGSAGDNVYESQESMETVFPQIAPNPHWVDNAGLGVNTNCVSCVTAAYLRLSGKDPTAVPNPSKGYSPFYDLLPILPAGFLKGNMTLKEIEVEMHDAGDGALGVVAIHLGGDKYHVINAMTKGDKVYFIDPQLGKIVTLKRGLELRLGRP
ncbi:MAG: hypothetical protein E6Q98_26120 [Rhodospirillaceae bacterium]|nr:MAG: hypothetical protein E6Q98_26120 [Rhodospirillaceae bacterium]